MKPSVIAGLILLISWVAVGTLPAEPVKSGDQINWHTYDQGKTQARQSGKSMVLYFYADWCSYCVRMQEETFSHASVVDFMNDKVVAVKVDVDQDKQLARSFGVRGLPATVLINRNGDKVGPLPGFIPAKSFLAMLTKIMEQS